MMLDNDGALLPEKKAIHVFSIHVHASRFTSLPVIVPIATHHVILFSSIYIARSYHGLVSLKHHVVPHQVRVCTTSSKNDFSGHITN
jgi:hypothetical protein